MGFHQAFLQAAVQGIGVFCASGDKGDLLAATNLVQAAYPASDPYVTAVGGTSTAIGEMGNLEWQTGWGSETYDLSADGASWLPGAPDRFDGGAGGGFSTLFGRPAYQAWVVPSSLSPGRAVPDVALDADSTTGMLIGRTQRYPDGSVHYGEYRIGGTSLASPLMAGIQALATEHAGTRLGFANPAIYAQVRARRGTFADVTPVHHDDANVIPDYSSEGDPTSPATYSLSTFDHDAGLTTARGWDSVTGVGSPTPSYPTTASPPSTGR